MSIGIKVFNFGITESARELYSTHVFYFLLLGIVSRQKIYPAAELIQQPLDRFALAGIDF